MAGGDTGGVLIGGAIHLATSTVSSNTAQIFNTATDTFLAVGNLNTARESTATLALPNGLTLIIGGNDCALSSFSGNAGYACTALQTAELYNESTKTFSLAGSGSGGLMTIARSGPAATLISGSGTALDGQVLIFGGSTGSSFTAQSGSAIPGQPSETALNSAELYNPATDAFTAISGAIPTCATGHSSPPPNMETCAPGATCDCTTGLPSVCPGPSATVSSATESGTTVTITTTPANPSGLTVGLGVSLQSVTVAGYNGIFAVTAIPSSTTFQYTTVSGLASTTTSGGTAAADTSACGIVDEGAALIPNDGGKVLLAGGDLVSFLGESSNLSFIFDPTTETFSETAGAMTNPRELFPLIGLDPSVVTGPLAGQVVAMGGIRANSGVCTTTGSIVATTLNEAEVFDPTSGTWSATANTMFTQRTSTATLIRSGADAGEIILPGGVNVEAGTFPSTCAGLTSLKQGATALTDLYDPAEGTGGTFIATGSLNQAREGQAQGELGAGTDSGDIFIAGGACTTTSPSLQSLVIGSSAAGITCANTNGTGAGCSATKSAVNDYSEVFNPASGGSWSCGPTFASGFGPSNGAAAAILP